jgi:hypothetical protein
MDRRYEWVTVDAVNTTMMSYLQLLERIQNLPPEQQEAEKAEFRRTHPDMDGVARRSGSRCSR